MITGPPPKFHGVRDILPRRTRHLLPVPRPRPRRPVHHLVRRRPRRRRDRRREDPTAMSASELLRRTLRLDRQKRTHRPHPHPRRTPPADRPRPVRHPLQRPPATSSTTTSPATPRSSRPASRPPANQAPSSSRRTDQRVRARRLTPQVSSHGRVLEPHRVAPRATAWPWPARVPAAWSRLCAIAAHSAQAELAPKCPDGRCARARRSGRRTRFR
jgi:hypothetical protein